MSDHTIICPRCGSFDTEPERESATIRCRRCDTISPTRRRRWLFDLASIACGMVIALIALLDLVGGITSLSWPSSQGTVIESTVRKQDRLRRSRSSHRPIVVIGYEVAGQQHTTQEFRCHGYAPSFVHRAEAEAFIARYPAGATLKVYYDPERPQSDCLITGTPHWAFDLVALVGAF